jgi:glycosyltransferase involved in cell wall biosynthesis
VCEDCLGKLPWRGVVHRCYRGSAPQTAVVASMIGVHRAIGTYRSKVSRYIALTEFSRSKFIAGGLPGEQISVKPNFVDLPVPENERQRSGALFVGRLSPEKGTRVLARAAATRRHAVIDIIGTGPEQSSLEASPGIRLLGWQVPETIYARMREATCLVVPSIWYENFPRTIVEAFACGLPVIASRLGAMAEIVRDGATGLLFEAGNADDLAQKMAWAEANPVAMRGMGMEARREYEAKYTPAVNYRQLMTIYAEAIAVAQPRASNR